MFVTYIYCNSCSYEDENIKVDFSRATASGDFVFCPKCHAEAHDFEEH